MIVMFRLICVQLGSRLRAQGNAAGNLGRPFFNLFPDPKPSTLNLKKLKNLKLQTRTNPCQTPLPSTLKPPKTPRNPAGLDEGGDVEVGLPEGFEQGVVSAAGPHRLGLAPLGRLWENTLQP